MPAGECLDGHHGAGAQVDDRLEVGADGTALESDDQRSGLVRVGRRRFTSGLPGLDVGIGHRDGPVETGLRAAPADADGCGDLRRLERLAGDPFQFGHLVVADADHHGTESVAADVSAEVAVAEHLTHHGPGDSKVLVARRMTVQFVAALQAMQLDQHHRGRLAELAAELLVAA